MSGHSHAKTIKHQKNITDQKRGQLFSKMARVIAIAVKQGNGSNPETNTKLKTAVEKAKESNMPRENIERAIEQAIGGPEGATLEEVVFEGYGPGGIAIIVEGITNNKNRTLGDIKQVLNQNGGKLAQEGSVRWMFDRKGIISFDSKAQAENLQSKEEIELKAIEAGADDIRWENDIINIYTKPEELENVKSALEKQGFKIESSGLEWTPKEELNLDDNTKTSAQKLFDALDENDDIQDIYSNLKE